MCRSIEPPAEFLEGIKHGRRDENGERRWGWRIPLPERLLRLAVAAGICTKTSDLELHPSNSRQG